MNLNYRMKKNIIFLIAFLLFACSTPDKIKNQVQKITLSSLLNEMTDFQKLMETPKPNYKCIQFSSYDRRSTDPKKKNPSGWYANSDIGRYVRIETNKGRVEYVMADVNGPGAIVRIWSAFPQGTIRVYLDNAKEPEIEMPMYDMLYGESKFFFPPIAGIYGMGGNSYMPIPFAQRCKITSTTKKVYYQVNCRVYKGNVNVETFTLKNLKEKSELVKKINNSLKSPEKLQINPSDHNTTSATPLIKPGKSFKIPVNKNKKGNKIIYNFECKVVNGDLEKTLRGCLLEISFDDMKEPAVQAPLGDFFGTAPGLNKYKSLPLGVLDDGTMYCHFLMPYKNKCSIKIINTTTNEVKLSYKILTMPSKWSKQSQYFCAKWKVWYNYKTRPISEFNLFECEGKGKYVGNMYQISNPVPNWWGEGDEKVYIDGEKFPSIFGTGTEDYYGYSYCWNALFMHAYHNQVRADGPGNFGHTCVSRFHFLDAFTFDKSIKFNLEMWHQVNTKVSVATTVYWYERPGAKDNFKPIKKDQLIIPKLPEFKKIPGAIEGEEMKVIKITGGKICDSILGETGVNQNDVAKDFPSLVPCLITGWQSIDRSKGNALWWKDLNTNDELVLEFYSDKAGTNEVLYSGTYSMIFGVYDIYINDNPADKPLDLFSKSTRSTGEIKLGKFFINKGKNTIKIVVKEKKRKVALFVLDYIKLQKVNF